MNGSLTVPRPVVIGVFETRRLLWSHAIWNFRQMMTRRDLVRGIEALTVRSETGDARQALRLRMGLAWGLLWHSVSISTALEG